jgi:drug/metabolite transporter (DMT)-like permease
MVAILVGVFLTSLPNLSNRNLSGGGVTIAVGSGIAFALYLIFMQLSFKRIHPVPATLVQFFTIFVLSSFALIIPVELGVRVKDTFGFLMGGVILGLLTLAGYLANNIGVKLMGAGRASIVASSGPVVTALLALLLINAQLRPASLFGINLPVQAIGIVLVTLGVAALAFERLKIQTPPPKPSR